MLRLAFDFIITWRETRTRPNAYAGITNSYNHQAAEDALRSAAYTYVVAALSSLATLVYYIMIYMGRRE